MDTIVLQHDIIWIQLLYIAWRSDPKSSQKKEMEEEVEEKLEAGQGKSSLQCFLSWFLTPRFLELKLLGETVLFRWRLQIYVDRHLIGKRQLGRHFHLRCNCMFSKSLFTDKEGRQRSGCPISISKHW
ncbi:hypothetical protein MLD38_027444 [Melastoma candidum]|uniref:Uncharacterized protein n=1 Tax=Melastoma candidum TaxID=119954 RepID=A0ACB9P296_9MYRT|nr:hypothetical protein MLD38_027444 [Melastoma candidum]